MRPCRRNGDGLAQVPNLSIPSCKRPAKEVTRKSARVCLSPPLSTSHGREWCETAQANAALSAAGTIVRIRYPSQSGGQNDDSRADLYGKLEELENRDALLRGFDAGFEAASRNASLLDGLDTFHRQAVEILRSSRTREAFNLEHEPMALRQRYGDTPFFLANYKTYTMIGVSATKTITANWK